MNLSNTSFNVSANLTNGTSDKTYFNCLEQEQVNYVTAAFGVLIIVTNIVNIIVFSQENMRKSSMNVYLLAKSASDLYLGMEVSLEPMTSCVTCFTRFVYWYQIFTWIYQGYLGFIAQLSSIMLAVAATFDRYVFISQECKFYKRIDHRLVIFLVYFFCALFYIYKFWVWGIISSVNDLGLIELRTDYSEFGIRIGRDIFETLHTVFRDIVFVVLLIIFNVLILIEMKRAMAKKKTISGANFAKTTTTTTKSKADRAEEKITIMVVLTGIAAVIAHFFPFLGFLPIPLFYDVTRSRCFSQVSIFLYCLSYYVDCFFYISFNNVYRETFVGLFTCCRTGKTSPKAGNNTTSTVNSGTKLSTLKKNGDTKV